MSGTALQKKEDHKCSIGHAKFETSFRHLRGDVYIGYRSLKVRRNLGDTNLGAETNKRYLKE